MIYLSGAVVEGLVHPMLGFMNTPDMANILPAATPWAADNGRFNAPERYTHERYLGWLRLQDPAWCMFATAPDQLGDHAATVALSTPLFPYLRHAGYRPAFVAQDGFDPNTTPWHGFDFLFLGGSTEFKLGAGLQAAREAQRRGKLVHMGRVNSYKRLCIARDAGCVSADGTFLKYGPKFNVPRLLKWFDRLDRRDAVREACPCD